MKIKKIFKFLFTIFSSILFLALTKIKFGPILGTKMKFSFVAFFGPTLAKIFGIGYGTGIIILTNLIGLIAGVYKIKATKDYFTFLPIIFAGVYFSKIFRGNKKLIIIPLICILLFVINPIGKTVWFYSGFWLIPISLSLFKEKIDKVFKIPLFKIYGYSLASAFVDHAVGSVIYLYLLKIPAHFWVEAIPMTIIERLMIAAGIELCYFAEIVIIKVFGKIPILFKIKSFVFKEN